MNEMLYAGPCGEGIAEYGHLITADQAIQELPEWEMVFRNPETQWIRMNSREITCGMERENGSRTIRQFRLRDGAQRVSGANSSSQSSTWIWSDWM